MSEYRWGVLLRGLLRQNRECSLSKLLLLEELEEWGGELSSLALERRLKLKALRVLLADARREGLIEVRQDKNDGKMWRLSEEGRRVLNDTKRRCGSE